MNVESAYEYLKKNQIMRGLNALNYFTTGLTNGRTEGFNGLAKLLQKRAFGTVEP